MGLDVFLHRCTNLPLYTERKRAMEAAVEKHWDDNFGPGPYNSSAAWGERKREIGEARYKEIQAEANAIELAFEEELDDLGIEFEDIEMKSTLFPNHMFEIGYYRSSYNDSGINSHMYDRGLPSLYEIFPTDNDTGEYVQPDWAQSLETVTDAVLRYEEYLKNNPLSKVKAVVQHIYSEEVLGWSGSGRMGMKRYEEVINSDAYQSAVKGKYDYTSRDSVVFTKPVTLYAMFLYKNAVVYIVNADNNDEGEDWYLKALKIVKESIEYVLAQENPEQFCFTWSG